MALEVYRNQGGKKLRCGYTTGTCAALAAQAAARALLLGETPAQASLVTPKGIPVQAPVLDLCRQPGGAYCAVEKDAGDDFDVTHGMKVGVWLYTAPEGIWVDGGEGVGRVTKPGLDQPVGAAAINSVPREMIRRAVEQVCRLADYQGGLRVVISAPEGEALARRTFNPRLGILGGISILGTTGIVEPMSERALIDTIRVELRQRRAGGAEYVLLTPGNYGTDFIRQSLGIGPQAAVQCSNFIGDALDICRELGFRGALLIGHIGKLVKIGGGMLNTHSRYGDCRMEILAAYGAAAGLPASRVEALLACVTCDDALGVLEASGVMEGCLQRLVDRVAFHLQARGGDGLETGAVLFSKRYGLLGRTANAKTLLRRAAPQSAV